MSFIAALTEAVGGRKHVVVLKPLMSKHDPTKFRKKYSDWQVTQAADEAVGIRQPTYDAGYVQNYHAQWAEYQQNLEARRATPEWKAAFDRLRDETLEKLPAMRDKKRVIEADYVAPLDDGSMVLGIGPGSFTSETRGFHGDRLRKKRRQTDIYASIIWNPQANAYVTTRKFEKILTVNMDNIESIDGKPAMGGSRTMDKGIQHLDLEEAMDPMQPQPKKFRIIMRSQSVEDRAAETEERGYIDPLPARNATVIDADHVAMLTDEIYIVGIGPGTFTHQSHHTHPRPHPDFYIIKHTQPYQPNSCVFWGGEVPTWQEIDAAGNEITKPDGHTDWVITKKFKKILTMHAKNIQSINGKPVLHAGEGGDRGVGHLGQFDEGWTIDGISDLLED